MKTLGTVHSNYIHVVVCLQKRVLRSLCYRFCYRLVVVFMPGASRNTMWHDNDVAQG